MLLKVVEHEDTRLRPQLVLPRGKAQGHVVSQPLRYSADSCEGTTRPFLATRILSLHKNPTAISHQRRGTEWFATKATIHYATPSPESVLSPTL